MKSLRAFVTVGTDHHPFDRLSDWIDEAVVQVPGLSVHMQFGTSRPPTRVTATAYMAYHEMQRLMHDADIVICHGGPATIIEARAAGHRPIVVPRLPERGEHVDGHQARFSTWMHARGQVLHAEHCEELIDLLRGVAAGTVDTRCGRRDNRPVTGVVRFDTLVAPLLHKRTRAFDAARPLPAATPRERHSQRGRFRRAV